MTSTRRNLTRNDYLSVIIPCFNEEEIIRETIVRILNTCDKLEFLDYEIILVDDGSKDQTINILKELSHFDKRLRVISFSRNFGHQIAVTAGIDAAKGDAVVLIDADLQDPPELIIEMINKWRDGYEVIYGTRIQREGESFFKTSTASIFYRLLNKLSEISIPLDTGDFRLIDKNVVDALRAMTERDRFVRGMISWTGFKQISIPYKRDKRLAGTSKYPLKKMILFAIDGVISFSTIPLRIAVGLGVFSAAISILGIVYALYMRIFTNIWVPGWTALVVTILLLGGIQLICLGILGEYVGRIYSEIKNRPLYVVKEYVNFDIAGPEFTRSPTGVKL